tara:strand:+ start:20960 stop:22963 length:2004 start_codon:yes stop_codon:yes gene_type:complete
MSKVFLFLITTLIGTTLQAKPLDLDYKGLPNAKQVDLKVDTLKNNEAILITVRSESVVFEDWAKPLCDEARDMLNRILKNPTQAHCYRFSEPVDIVKFVSQKKREMYLGLHLDIEKNIQGGLILNMSDLRRSDPLIRAVVGWKVHHGDLKSLDEKIAGSLAMFEKMDWVKSALLDLVIEEEYKGISTEYLKTMSDSEKLSRLKKNPRFSQDTARFMTAMTQMIAALGIGWYGYHNLSDNTKDYDYDNFKTTLKNKIRFGSMARYDDNGFGTNYTHTYAGVGYYLICRGNGFTALQSYLCATAGSLAWEAVIEWREVFSINDQIFTAHGGAILGEAIYQTGIYLFSHGPSWLKGSLGWAWRGPAEFSDWMSGRFFDGKPRVSVKQDVTGHFNIEVGFMRTKKRGTEKSIALDTEVVRIPFHEQPGEMSDFLLDVVQTDFRFSAPLSADFMDQQKIFSKVVFAAYHHKRLTLDANEKLRGYSLYVGPSAALEIVNDKNFHDDFYAITHIVGGSLRMESFFSGIKVTTTFDAWGDAIMMKSMAIESYKKDNPNTELINILQNNDYYYGWGSTTRGQIIVEFGHAWNVGAEIRKTIGNGTNERQKVTNPNAVALSLKDEVLDFGVFIEKAITPTLKVKLATNRYKRQGRIGGYGQQTVSERRTQVSMIYHF